jgi:hypothetical protein
VSNPAGGGGSVESRFFFEGTVSGGAGGWTSGALGTATDAREASRIGIFGTSNSYGGSYGRVSNEAIGRDLNPLGRGDGEAYVAGSGNLYSIAPRLPLTEAMRGSGNSANNQSDWSSGGSTKNTLGSNPNIQWDCWFGWKQALQMEIDHSDPRTCHRKPNCHQCPDWGCSGQDFLNDLEGCAYKWCEWVRTRPTGCSMSNCVQYTFRGTIPCYPYWGIPHGYHGACIQCGKDDPCATTPISQINCPGCYSNTIFSSGVSRPSPQGSMVAPSTPYRPSRLEYCCCRCWQFRKCTQGMCGPNGTMSGYVQQLIDVYKYWINPILSGVNILGSLAITVGTVAITGVNPAVGGVFGKVAPFAWAADMSRAWYASVMAQQAISQLKMTPSERSCFNCIKGCLSTMNVNMWDEGALVAAWNLGPAILGLFPGTSGLVVGTMTRPLTGILGEESDTNPWLDYGL